MSQSSATLVKTKSTRLTGGNSTAAIAGDDDAGFPGRCGYVDWTQENKADQLVVVLPLFGRRSQLRRTLLRWCTTAINRLDATVHDKTPIRALEVRELTVKQMRYSMTSIDDGGECTFADSGE
jgi:hypothetical protein